MPDCTDIKTPEEIQRSAVQQAVTAAIDRMREKLESGEFKMSIAEFARLLELQKELATENIRHVKVTWVNPFEQTVPVSEI